MRNDRHLSLLVASLSLALDDWKFHWETEEYDNTNLNFCTLQHFRCSEKVWNMFRGHACSGHCTWQGSKHPQVGEEGPVLGILICISLL